MARILICDRCNTQDGVHEGRLDLCGACAAAVLDALLADDGTEQASRIRAAVVAIVGKKVEPAAATKAKDQPAAPTPPPPPLTDQEKADRRRLELMAEHQTDIFAVKPTYALRDFPQTIKYGPRGQESNVEVLEPVLSMPGHYFAKIVG